MALKSKEWFYKRCLQEVKEHRRFCHLCWDILEKGIGQTNATRGHVTQAIGVAQQFLSEYPEYIETIQEADATRPFNVAGSEELQETLVNWLDECDGDLSAKFGYSYDTFKNIVTPTLGGTRTGGGGGDDEFKRVLRLMAEFI